MPEIAEVALMSDAIREIIQGQQLNKITVINGKYINGLPNLETLSQVLPLDVISVNVKGKFCWIELAQNWYICITFGMSGGIFYEPTDQILHEYMIQTGQQITRELYMKHFHIKFEITNGNCFYFGDPRRFGTVILSNDRYSLDKKLSQLGPDMLTGPPISNEQFINIFRQNRFNTKNICQVLMQQKAISGVGNYIKAEVLYQCHISPWALVCDLDDNVLQQLHQSIRHITQLAYNGHGASLYSYTGTRREKGEFQNMLQVYGKSVDPLGNPVLQIPDNLSPDKRTTHYVPKIQTIGDYHDPNRKKIIIKLKTKS